MRVVHSALFVLAALEIIFVVMVGRSANPAWPSTRIAGACILFFVVVWVGIARYQLGKSFSVTAQARQLVTDGLYARFRNPIYLASPMLPIGLSLVLAQWWPLLLLLVIVPMQVVRARREAAVLQAAFGAEYELYRARTWF